MYTVRDPLCIMCVRVGSVGRKLQQEIPSVTHMSNSRV